jgi:hypothetical protein
VAEAGGPATQAGVFYQNTIAALYLGRMLDLRSRPASHRVTNIRVEAPEEVDDIVVRLGDGTRRFIQAKRTITAVSDAWHGVWTSFSRQIESAGVNQRSQATYAIAVSVPQALSVTPSILRD